MILKFWDKSYVVVTKEQWQQIKYQRDVEGATWIVLSKPEMEFDPRTIAKVEAGGYTEADRVPETRRIAAQHEITDEERARNLERLAQIKADFAKRRAAKAEKANKTVDN